MNNKKSTLVMIFLILTLMPSGANATVYEFDMSGDMTIYEAPTHFSFKRAQASKNSTEKQTNHIGSPEEIEKEVIKAANLYSVNVDLIHAIIMAESAYNPKAVSSKGAIGLMQLMPDTARHYGVSNAFSVEENIHAGTKLLRHLLDKYQDNIFLVVAAYNAGEGAVDRYKGIPPYQETVQYVRRVSRILEGLE